MELVEYSASQCPRTQASVVCGWVGRILDNLITNGSAHPLIEQCVQDWLQSQFTVTILTLLEKASDKVAIVYDIINTFILWLIYFLTF